MNRDERSQIREQILACRRLLRQEFDELLRLHGLLPDRKVAAPPGRQELRTTLDEAFAREGGNYAAARERYLEHAAFTFLNRVLALRVAEANGLVMETVPARGEYGHRSRRERDLADADPELAGQPENLAQEALRQAFSEMRERVSLLFDDDEEPYGMLLPRLPAYRELRQTLSRVSDDLWRDFETLGWAYQYFNSEVRDDIRHHLRRNPTPDQIPPLNQFYTVDWIVKALVQNTIGRIWLEAHPDSFLRAKLDWLVPVQNDLASPGRKLDLAEFKVLDPACGSGHFLLGAFDLLLDMWREAHPDVPEWRIPALVLEHNLFGVDIDLRASQIAASALYLKALATFEHSRGQDSKAVFRPRRLNIACADIRFTDGGRREQFLATFDADRPVQKIVEETLDACGHAFEIGSLLRIRQPFEKLFKSRVAKPAELEQKAKQLSFLTPEYQQLSLGDIPVSIPKDLTVEEIVVGIRDYARQATRAHDLGSKLFGYDAEHALELIDVLTDRYDVILMNPPYGTMPVACKEYARDQYPRTHNYFYSAFIEQAIDLCKDDGYVGALTARTFMFLKSFQKLREEILRQDALAEVIWDLGFNVLDEATARYAAFTLRQRYPQDGVDWRKHPVTFFRLTEWAWDGKRAKFEEALSEMTRSQGKVGRDARS
ncbi:MAG: BREX-1 system adenine-specific DNA-methyltransferase PglX [Chloroflexi bacterium]|nr:BREX-1 system adenine-specific DNA-methyltransferase PglX [Chloroflexota bacterium]MDA8187558.1 Eco57I restriction-modification methylase domain-containing protein [Dehalococcoidales bacterium]